MEIGFAELTDEWSWEENKQFELALAVVDELDPNRWEVVAAMVGGNRSSEELQKQYFILVEDLQLIESGVMDENLVFEDYHSICWGDDEDYQKYVHMMVL